jgi:hypothetical protein
LRLNPLFDTVFEHLAFEIQTRNRVLDQIRQNHKSWDVFQDRDGISTNSIPVLKIFAVDLSDVRSIEELASRLQMVDEDFKVSTIFSILLDYYQPSKE